MKSSKEREKEKKKNRKKKEKINADTTFYQIGNSIDSGRRARCGMGGFRIDACYEERTFVSFDMAKTKDFRQY